MGADLGWKGEASVTKAEEFVLFWGGPFSQWAASEFVIDGVKYNCAEQFMMAEKARLFRDGEALAEIMATRDPAAQKAIGRRVRGFDVARWEFVAREIVYKGNYAKFTQNPELRKELDATAGKTIVEASPHDVIWGIGLSETDPDALDRTKWRGRNWLGRVLTCLRDDLGGR